MTTIASAKAAVKALGMIFSKTSDGEFRVGFYHNEASAYYTDDIDDAVSTARHMAARERSIKMMVDEVISKTRR